MQHWYDKLEVGEEGFAVTLNFGDAPEPLYIPYDAIKTFVDPSVEFGLRFETQESDETPVAVPDVPEPDEPVNEKEDDAPEPEERKEADVVSLDSFRKS
jgi:hypothetical protein